MDRASSLIFPGSKTLAGWWRQLAGHHPQALWVAYAFLHRIDAAVTVLRDQPVEPLNLLTLQAMALECAGGNHQAGVTLTDLQARLSLPPPILQRVLIGMENVGLVARASVNAWQTSAAGQQALRLKQTPVRVRERRVFPFVERMDASGQRAAAHYLPIDECVHVGWQVDEAHRFEGRWLAEAIGQDAAWKQSFGFPEGVLAWTAEPSEDGSHVLIDRPERVLLVMIWAGAAKELLGFAVKVDGWTLFDRTPVLRLPAAAHEIWPETMAEPPVTLWQETWRDWCRQRQMPVNEVESCSLVYHAPRLEVNAPSRLVQRLQAVKSDLFKGEAWILVGEGYTRIAAQLNMRV
jgi:hypothetical protein